MSEHAIGNARAWAASIREAMDVYREIDSGDAETVTYDGESFDDADELRQRIEEMPLSIAVRTGWFSPGEERPAPEEFEILLSTGGPALRITGEIGGSYPELQWQDWGTPWTLYRETSDDEDKAISAFVGLFYFGEG